jgi:hypothetical protein
VTAAPQRAPEEEEEEEEAPTVAELLRDGAKCDRTTPLWRAFLEFHHANPQVYVRLKELCHELCQAGFQRYSTRTLICVLRFEWDLKTGGQEVIIAGEPRFVKLNNNHTPYYARMLIEEMPGMAGFFELRHVEGDPTCLPPKRTFRDWLQGLIR